MIEKIKSAISTNRNLVSNVVFMVFIKGGALLLALYTMPSYMRYFDDKTVLGVWFTMLSVLSWVLSFDFGIGNGLRNQLVPALVEKDTEKQKELISSSYISLFFLSVLIAMILVAAAFFINWNVIFNIPDTSLANETLRRAVIISLTGIVLQFSLRLISSILYAMQKAFLPNLLSLFSTLLLLVSVNACIAADHKNDIVLLAVLNLLSVNIPLLITTILLFATKLKNTKPSFRYFNTHTAKNVYKIGVLFLWLQFMALVINSTNDFLITALIEPGQVVVYQCYNKIFLLLSSVISLAVVPVWSAVTKAKVEGNYRWIRKAFYFLHGLVALQLLVSSVILVPVLQLIFDFWLKENSFTVNIPIAVAFIFFSTVNIWSGVIATMANGLGRLKIQMIFLTFGALINIPLSMLFVHFNHSFVSILLSNILSLLPYCILQTISLFIFFKKTLNNVH